MEDAVELDIRPRFPLFGGWKTNYYIGYNLPSYEYLFVSGELSLSTVSEISRNYQYSAEIVRRWANGKFLGNKYVLRMRFIDHIYDNFVIDDFSIKIILPEGSR